MKRNLRIGFNEFLMPVLDKVRNRKIVWNVILCGPRGDAVRSFLIGIKQHSQATNILLVDSESPVDSSTEDFLRKEFKDLLKSVNESMCHLMVQVMEAWFIADPEMLAEFYGNGFQGSAIPGNQNVEQIPKKQIFKSLKAATRNTKLSDYLKGSHSHGILKRIRLSVV